MSSSDVQKIAILFPASPTVWDAARIFLSVYLFSWKWSASNPWMCAIFKINIWINNHLFLHVSLSNREISMLPRSQPIFFNGSWKLMRRRRPGKSLDYWKEIDHKISPLQWECSTHKASETSISKYPVPGVSQCVHETASMWCPAWCCTLFTAGGKWRTTVSEHRAQEPRHTATLGWDKSRCNSVIYTHQMSTNFKESRRWLRWSETMQSVLRLSPLPHWSKVQPLCHGSSPPPSVTPHNFSSVARSLTKKCKDLVQIRC